MKLLLKALLVCLLFTNCLCSLSLYIRLNNPFFTETIDYTICKVVDKVIFPNNTVAVYTSNTNSTELGVKYFDYNFKQEIQLYLLQNYYQIGSFHKCYDGSLDIKYKAYEDSKIYRERDGIIFFILFTVFTTILTCLLFDSQNLYLPFILIGYQYYNTYILFENNNIT